MLDGPHNNDRGKVKSFSKIVHILNCFSALDRSLSVTEIAKKIEVPRATAHRLLTTLREFGFVEQERERDRYRLGLKLLELGGLVLSNMDIHREARPFVEELGRMSDETVHLCVFDGMQVIFIDRKITHAGRSDVLTTIGNSPLHCTALGKVVLAHQGEDTIARVIKLGLKQYTRDTITDPEILREELARIVERGYATNNGEHRPGMRCVAAPIWNASGKVFAAISITGPAERLPDARIAYLAEHVIASASEISSRLGFRAQGSHGLKALHRAGTAVP